MVGELGLAGRLHRPALRADPELVGAVVRRLARPLLHALPGRRVNGVGLLGVLDPAVDDGAVASPHDVDADVGRLAVREHVRHLRLADPVVVGLVRLRGHGLQLEAARIRDLVGGDDPQPGRRGRAVVVGVGHLRPAGGGLGRHLRGHRPGGGQGRPDRDPPAVASAELHLGDVLQVVAGDLDLGVGGRLVNSAAGGDADHVASLRCARRGDAAALRKRGGDPHRQRDCGYRRSYR